MNEVRSDFLTLHCGKQCVGKMCSKLYFCGHKYPSDIQAQKFTCQQSWDNTRNSYYLIISIWKREHICARLD